MTSVGRGQRGTRNVAAYPIHDEKGRPAWQGVIVVEPADYRWWCPHGSGPDVHYDHDEAVACAREARP